MIWYEARYKRLTIPFPLPKEVWHSSTTIPVGWLISYNRGANPGRYFLLGFLRTSDDIDKFPVRMTTILGI